jgi:hypothetical protein
MSSQPTTNELEPLYAQRHEPEDVAHALATLAMCGGNARQARERLLAGGIDVPNAPSTTGEPNGSPNATARPAKTLAPQIEAQVVDFQRELAYRASQAAQHAVALELERIHAREVKDAAQAPETSPPPQASP